MVGKVTSGSSFSGLAAYLTGDRERVAWTEARWMIGTDPKEIAREMESAAGQSSRVEKPVYHISLSFDPADAPTRAQLQEAASEVLKDLGLGEHQAYLVAHQDKGHPHVHIMVNRVHPESGKAWSTSHDYARVERTLRRLEEAWGLRRVPGHHARAAGAERPDRTQARKTGEIRRARRTGEKPFADVVRVKVGRDIAKAKTWGELVGALKQQGLRVEARGRGMVITDGQRFTAASRVARDASRYRLERRFGQTLSDYLAGDRTATPGRGSSPAPGREDIGGELQNGTGPGGAMQAYRAVREARGVRRMQENPEKEVPRRAQQAAIGIARKLVSGDPALRKIYADLTAYQDVRAKESALQEALRDHSGAERRLKQIPETEQRAVRLSKAFDGELARVYRDPQAARWAYESMAEKQGAPAAIEAMKNRPEHFGPVITDERRKWLGLATETKKESAYQAARSAADVGRQYVQAWAQIPSKKEQDVLRSFVDQKGREIRNLQSTLGKQPGSQKLLATLGERAAKLTPRQMSQLEKVLTPKQFSVVTQAVSRALAVVKGRGR